MAEKIDINKASADELARMPMVGRQRAESIIRYRNEHGPFRNWDDLDKIPGFSRGMIEDLKRGGLMLGGKQ